MTQYTEGSTDTPAKPIKAANDTKYVQELETKVATLENFVHSQGEDILKMRRDIIRIKADIEKLTSVLRRG
jgi:hypothetical protein